MPSDWSSAGAPCPMNTTQIIPFGSASAESSPAFANISDGVPSESLSHTTLSGRSPRVPSNQRTHARPFASAPAMSGSFA